jgi:hypothetical protein
MTRQCSPGLSTRCHKSGSGQLSGSGLAAMTVIIRITIGKQIRCNWVKAIRSEKLPNPLTLSGESCSDWAENFSVASFIYLQTIMLNALIFYLALLKSYSRFRPFNFWKFITVQCFKKCSKIKPYGLASCVKSS